MSEFPGYYSLNSVTFGKGTFVAVGNYSAILISTDGTNWTSRSARLNYGDNSSYWSELVQAGGDSIEIMDPLKYQQRAVAPLASLEAVCYGLNRFVAVGEGGAILVSASGTEWTQAAPLGGPDLIGVACGNGKFAALARDGAIRISEDGSVWRDLGVVIRTEVEAITFGGGRFVAVGADGAIFTSENALQWSQHGCRGYSEPLQYVSFANGVFVAAPRPGHCAWLTSSNGLDWQFCLPPVIEDLAFGNGRFAGTVFGGTATAQPSSMRWVENRSLWVPDKTHITFGKGLFVVVSRAAIVVSSDGEHWAVMKMPYSKILAGVADADGILLGLGTYLQTRDGVTWSNGWNTPISGNVFGNVSLPRANLNNYLVLSTEDGILWTRRAGGRWAHPGFLATDSAVSSQRTNTAASPVSTLQGRSRGGFGPGPLGATGGLYRIQASTDLLHWVDVGAYSGSASISRLIDSDSSHLPTRFYRVVTP
jgi:hypothetical protein